MSPNHSGAINQVLYADGRVVVLTSNKLQEGQDDLFHNIKGDVEAGFGREDSVLGRSEATPGIFFINPDGAQAECAAIAEIARKSRGRASAPSKIDT